MPTIVEARVLFRPEPPYLRFLPEGPYRLTDDRVSWVSIQHGANTDYGSLNILNLVSGDNLTYDLPGRPGFAFPCHEPSRFVVGCENRLGIFDIRDNSWKPFGPVVDADKEGTIINDGLVWEDNLIFGTKDLKFATKKAGLYLYRGKDDNLIRFRDDQICSNGKAIRETERGLQLIDIDSPTRRIVGYALEITDGTLAAPKLGEPTTLVDLTDDLAVPDGAILTPDGQSIIVSMYNPNPAEHGETRQYSLGDGSLEVTWQTPRSPQNTCPALVDYQGRVALLITTAVEHMPSERLADAINAGCLFIAETEFKTTGKQPRFEEV